VSIELVKRGVWRVRWREGGRNRSKVIGRKGDAEAFDAEIRRRQRMGSLGLLDSGRQTLSEFTEEWWDLHALPNLARSTQVTYSALFDTNIEPRLGG